MPQAQQEIASRRNNGNGNATKPAHEQQQQLKSSIGKLSGLQCDSFTLIDANNRAPPATNSNASQQGPSAGGREQEGSKPAQQQRVHAAANLFKQHQLADPTDGHRLRLLKVHNLDTSKLFGQQQQVHEPNNNTIVQRHHQLHSSPVGAAAISRMDSSNQQRQQRSPASASTNGALASDKSPEQSSANGGQTGSTNLSSSSTTTTTTTSATSYRQSLVQTTNTQPEPAAAATALQQQQSIPSYSSIFNQSAKTASNEPLINSSSTVASYSNRWLNSRSTTPPEQSRQQQQQQRQPTAGTILTKTGQRVPLKKQLAADLSESAAFLSNKKPSTATKRTPVVGSANSAGSSKNLFYPSRLLARRERGDCVVSTFDGPENGEDDDDDDDDENVANEENDDDEIDGVSVEGEQDAGGATTSGNSDEEDDGNDGNSANSAPDQAYESDAFDRQAKAPMIDERLIFGRDGKLILSHKTRRLAEESAKNSRNSNNKRSAPAGAAQNCNKYPGSAHYLHNNIKHHQLEMVAARHERKLGASGTLKSNGSGAAKKHQSDSNINSANQSKISMHEIGRPPSFNTCQKQSTNGSARDCRKLDLFDQVAHLNCHCNNCSKKQKMAAHSIAYINSGSAAKLANLEAGVPYPWVRKYPKTNIMHLILKSIILILCTMLLLVVTFSMVMLSIHMPHAFDKLLNVSRSFNVTIAGR